MKKPCLDCGILSEGSRCPEHAKEREATRARTDYSDSALRARGGTVEWTRIRDSHLKLEPTCRVCRAKGKTTKATVVDHIRSRRDGGGDEEENLRSLCDRHHGHVHSRWWREPKTAPLPGAEKKEYLVG